MAGNDQPSQPLSFTQVLARLEKGQLLSDLDAALKEVNAAVEETGKQGEITLKLKVSQTPSMENVVTVSPELTSKPPKLPRKPASFFKDGDDKLHLNDPRQSDMGLEGGPKEVGAQEKEG